MCMQWTGNTTSVFKTIQLLNNNLKKNQCFLNPRVKVFKQTWYDSSGLMTMESSAAALWLFSCLKKHSFQQLMPMPWNRYNKF